MKSLATAKLKRVRAVELAASGQSYDEIARQLGFSHRGSAHRAVYKALAERQVEAVDELRYMEVARLDAIQVALWDQALAGDRRAVLGVLRVIDQRCRLLGLYGTEPKDAGMRVLVRPREGNPGQATGDDTGVPGRALG